MSGIVNVTASNDQGKPVQGAKIAVVRMLSPVIQSVTVTPSVISGSSGVAIVRINATSPVGRPLTYKAVPNPGHGTVQQGQAPNEFVWRVP